MRAGSPTVKGCQPALTGMPLAFVINDVGKDIPRGIGSYFAFELGLGMEPFEYGCVSLYFLSFLLTLGSGLPVSIFVIAWIGEVQTVGYADELNRKDTSPAIQP